MITIIKNILEQEIWTIIYRYFYYLVSELKRFLSPGQDETVLFSATSDILIVRTNQVKFQLINYLYWFENLCFFKPKTILWMMKISKICLKQNLIFSKFWQSTTFFLKSGNFFSSFFYTVFQEKMFTTETEDVSL